MILEVKNPTMPMAKHKSGDYGQLVHQFGDVYIILGMGMGMPGDADAAYAASGSGGHTFASGYFRWILRDHEVPHH